MDRRKKKIGSRKQPRHLVEEILEDILLQQPVKTLVRLQLVSKAWASLIGSERFIKIHLQNSRANADLTNHSVIYDYLPDLVNPSLRRLKTNELKQYSVQSLMNDPVPDPSGFRNLTNFGIVGCCNGLVCIRNPSQKSISLWNPSTGIWIELPKLEPNSVIKRSGFGWDESSGAYKVFVFLSNTTDVGINICRVYSSNTNEWKTVETNPHRRIYFRKEEGLLLNGKLHWHGDERGAVVIISLDVKSAVIGVIDSHPCDYCRRSYRHRVSLGVLGGCLSAVQHHEQKQFHVWVMKEYGVKESWSRVMAVGLDPLMSCLYYVRFETIATVLGEGPDGEILISYGCFFFAYHPNKDAVVLGVEEIKQLKGIKEGARAHLYFESLVSPKTICSAIADQMDIRNTKIRGAKQSRHLPEEIIEEIVSKLPVKSLLRFRCVSRSWVSLIGSERFIKTHLQNSRDNTALAYHRVFFNHQERKPWAEVENAELKQYSLHSLIHGPIANPPWNMAHCSQFPMKNTIVGCCNGVVCILNRASGSFSVCNPSTRISIELPRMEPWAWVKKYGFGFDEWSGAYKMFVVLHRREVEMDGCKIYSSKTNAWKKVETDFDLGLLGKNEGVLVSGKLHWQRVRRDQTNVAEIVSFDLKSEVFEIMQHPCDSGSNVVGRVGRRVSLGELGGCLSVSHDPEKRLDVWVMKEYGVKESWYRAMAVRLDSFLDFSYMNPFEVSVASPIGIGPNGEILISYGSIFVAYDPQKEMVLQSKEIGDLCGGENAHLFFQTLVSPESSGIVVC